MQAINPNLHDTTTIVLSVIINTVIVMFLYLIKDFIGNAMNNITSSPPSICGETDCFNIGKEEVVSSEGNEDAIEMISTVSALIGGAGQEYTTLAAGFPGSAPVFTPCAIPEDQWPPSFN